MGTTRGANAWGLSSYVLTTALTDQQLQSNGRIERYARHDGNSTKRGSRMSIQTGLHGISLPTLGYRPGQRNARKQPAPAPKVSNIDKLAACLTDEWQSTNAIIKAAGIYPSAHAISNVKKLALSGRAESRTIPHGDGFRIQYRRAQA